RNGRPVRILLDPFTDFLVIQHVNRDQLANTRGLKDLDGTSRKTALRCLGCTFHKQNDGVARHGFTDEILNIIAHAYSRVEVAKSPPVTRSMPARSGRLWTRR